MLYSSIYYMYSYNTHCVLAFTIKMLNTIQHTIKCNNLHETYTTRLFTSNTAN